MGHSHMGHSHLGSGDWLVQLVERVDEVKNLLLRQAAGAAAKHLGLEVEDGREGGQQSAHEDLPARKCLQSGGRGVGSNEPAIR